MSFPDRAMLVALAAFVLTFVSAAAWVLTYHPRPARETDPSVAALALAPLPAVPPSVAFPSPPPPVALPSPPPAPVATPAPQEAPVHASRVADLPRPRPIRSTPVPTSTPAPAPSMPPLEFATAAARAEERERIETELEDGRITPADAAPRIIRLARATARARDASSREREGERFVLQNLITGSAFHGIPQGRLAADDVADARNVLSELSRAGES
jgi:hypothetical protein